MTGSDRKTHRTDQDPIAFLEAVEHPRRRADALAVHALMHEVTGAKATMWGPMVGFGTHRYTTADGKDRETFAVGLAPRKQALVVYGVPLDESTEALRDRLGRHSTGKGCLYLPSLAEVDQGVLRELLRAGWAANVDEA